MKSMLAGFTLALLSGTASGQTWHGRDGTVLCKGEHHPTVIAQHCKTAATDPSATIPGSSPTQLNQTYLDFTSMAVTPGGHGDKVASYMEAITLPNPSNISMNGTWALNPLTFCQQNSGGCITAEFDLNNFDCDPGPIDTPNPACTALAGAARKSMIGQLITGVAGYQLGEAILISAVYSTGGGWHHGLASTLPRGVTDSLLYESDDAVRGWEMKGTHSIGLDFSLARFKDAAIYLPAGGPANGITWTAASGRSSISTDAASNIIIRSPTNTEFQAPVIFTNLSTATHPSLTDSAAGNLIVDGTVKSPSMFFRDDVGPAWGKPDSATTCRWSHVGAPGAAGSKAYWNCNGVTLMSILDASPYTVTFKGSVVQNGLP